MSISMRVYIGPYVVASGTKNRSERYLLECFEDELRDGRGEGGVGDPKLYAVPSVDIVESGLGREVGQNGIETASITASAMQLEIEKMKNLANTFIAAIESSGGKCEVLWGVVCGWF